MKSFSQYIYESQLNEGFKDFIKNLYDVVSGKKRAERKRIEKEEIEQRKKDLEAWKNKFFDVVKNGTKKYDVLSITYKDTDFSNKYWIDHIDHGGSWKLIVLCDNNTLENAKNSYECSDYWGYLNAANDVKKLNNGFKIIFQPIFENNKLSAKSFFNEIRDKASLIYLFDCVDIKLNDKEDIDEIIDILKNRPRDFYGGNIDGIVKELESKK